MTARVKKEATAMDGGRFHAEAIFWFCQNSLSKVYMDVHFWRYFRFACINLLSKMYKGSTFFDSTALRANSQPSFFTLFSYIPLFRCFFHRWIPVLMRKVRIFEFLCPKKHSKIRTGSMRKPPVSLLSFKHFFHADALMIQPYGISKRRNGVGNA